MQPDAQAVLEVLQAVAAQLRCDIAKLKKLPTQSYYLACSGSFPYAVAGKPVEAKRTHFLTRLAPTRPSQVPLAGSFYLKAGGIFPHASASFQINRLRKQQRRRSRKESLKERSKERPSARTKKSTRINRRGCCFLAESTGKKGIITENGKAVRFTGCGTAIIIGFKERLSLRLDKVGDYGALVGVCVDSYDVDEWPGRGQASWGVDSDGDLYSEGRCVGGHHDDFEEGDTIALALGAGAGAGTLVLRWWRNGEEQRAVELGANGSDTIANVAYTYCVGSNYGSVWTIVGGEQDEDVEQGE